MKFFTFIKSTFFKIFLVGFALFYILSPMQNQIYSLLHKVSHKLGSENHHENSQKVSHKSHSHDHGFLSDHASENNHHHVKKETNTHHSHELLSFLSTIFKANDTKTENEELFFEVKLDKHIVPTKSDNQEYVIVIKTQKSWFYDLKMDSLRLDITTPPPKLTFL